MPPLTPAMQSALLSLYALFLKNAAKGGGTEAGLALIVRNVFFHEPNWDVLSISEADAHLSQNVEC